MTIFDFSKTIRLLEIYKEANKGEFTPLQRNLYFEAVKRLKQLEFLTQKIMAVESKLREQLDADLPQMIGRKVLPKGFFEKQNQFETENEIYTESFYYFAFRLRSIIKRLPGLKSFESKGIRDVRNHLIEHSDSPASELTNLGFGHGPNGPIVKPGRVMGQTDKFLDKGLYKNLEELLNNLNKKLKEYE